MNAETPTTRMLAAILDSVVRGLAEAGIPLTDEQAAFLTDAGPQMVAYVPERDAWSA